MKHIYLNLKRFDVPAELGGVNRLAPVAGWGRAIVEGTQEALKQYDPARVDFTMYLPEAHLPAAAAARCENSPVRLGCQGVYRDDTAPGGNFGAFTTNRPAAAAKALGCESVLIGHCEERADKLGILAEAGVKYAVALKSREIIEKMTGYRISDDEAGFIALHIHSGLSDEQVSDCLLYTSRRFVFL